MKKHRISYALLITFLAGCIWGEITADPISDWLFFKRASQGSIEGPEAVFYWYYLPALVYGGLLVLTILCYKFKIMGAQALSYFIVFLAAWGTINSVKTLGGGSQVALMLLVPFGLLAVFLFGYRVRR